MRGIYWESEEASALIRFARGVNAEGLRERERESCVGADGH